MPGSTFIDNLSGAMGRSAQALRQRLPKSFGARLIWVLAPLLVITTSWMALATSNATPPDIKPIDLATTPLYATATVDKPSMVLALSVEYPTVGAQYTSGRSENTLNIQDGSYTAAKEYLGYYDAESCYTYNNAPTEKPTSPQTLADYKRFDRTGSATERKCTDAFSGNFLNWATGSAVDMHRLALSGGDRYIDTSSLTILQRAVIPNGNPKCLWNSDFFPGKRLIKDGGTANTYWGAVPAFMIKAANGNDIYVANVLDRIYFGTSLAGSCDDTLAYRLGFGIKKTGKSPYAKAADVVISRTEDLPEGDGLDNDHYCNNDNTTPHKNEPCKFKGDGIKEVWYGRGNRWRVVAATVEIGCSSRELGRNNDPDKPGEDDTHDSCYYRDYKGSWTPPFATDADAGSALNSDGYFYARVQVCNTDSGVLKDVRNYDFCTKYPNGNYKPTGVIQKYSDQMRFAAFGYLLDNTLMPLNPKTGQYLSARYGGVLRAPMKYVGAKSYDSNGRDLGDNKNMEWDASTGVFKTNPDANESPAISGVINYLNKFGRTGTTPGLYKEYDPVGELHYEVIRYLQGLAPSPNAIKEPIDDTMKDGFPYFTSWTDPYGGDRKSDGDYSCIKSNILVIGDIGTHDHDLIPQPSIEDNIPDISYWRGVVQSFEKNTKGTYVDGQGKTQDITNPNTANNNVPSGTEESQIIGSAYWARTHDIRGSDWTKQPDKQRPGLRVKTFLFDVNQFGSEGNDAMRRTTNQFFMAAKYGGFETDPANPGGRPYNTKGNPFKDQSGKDNNDVWQKPDEPGEAGTYYFFNTAKASPARDMLTAFDEIFNRGSTISRSVTGGSLSTGPRLTEKSVSYSARFDASSWSGDVVAEPITQDASADNALVVGAPLWSAAQRLNTMSTPATKRKIFVGQTDITPNPTAVEFTWKEISETLKGYLNKANPSATTVDDKGEQRLAYLRGDRSKEGTPFRSRSSLLGDIVNSNVSYSGAPSDAFGGTGYEAFVKKHGSRKSTVFAGANDGMLHAFDAATGDELFAYIPSWLGRNLSALTAPGFTANHQNYVDAPSVVAQAQVADKGAATDWKTVLVSGTGGGGSGVFALDVSDPEKFGAANVMWEFTRAHDSDMGQVVGYPRIMKIKTSGADAKETYRWFAVVGSGVNNYMPDGDNRFSTDGKPALFLLALDKPAGDAWHLGRNYFKVSVPTDATLAKTTATGLANFSALYGAQGEMTDIYMGDLHGALWRLQFAGKKPTDWNMGKLSVFNKGTVAAPDPYPLYIARTADTSPKVQPIFAAPTVFVGPRMGGLETFYVVIGTGKYLELADKSSSTTQSVYALYDNGEAKADSSSPASIINGRGRLQAGSVDATDKTVTVSAFTWGRPGSDNDAKQRAGWYFDLPGTGEFIDQAALDVGALSAAIHSKIPQSSAGGTCASALGGGNQYFLTIDKGTGAYVPSTQGLLGPPVLAYSDADAKLTPSDSTGRRIRSTTMHRFTQTQGSIDTSAPAVTISETVGRLSWRQVFNYQDMKNAHDGR